MPPPTLPRQVTSGRIEMPAYLERLKGAIADEKGRAAGHKAAGDTAKALHAMRRAKIMTDEIASAAEGGGGAGA